MIACIVISASALIQLVLTFWFRNHMRKRERPTQLPDEHQHSTWIVMSCRGADPTLGDAVESLLSQDFRDYRMCVVVDNERDPAAKILSEIASRDDRLLVRHLQNPLKSCTLKCSAVVEGVNHILEKDADVQYFVFVDADSNPPANMMATLIGALHADAGLGLASGNQWFEPAEPASIGSIVRSMWYAGALFFSMLFENPWAGAYAMRAEDIRRTGLTGVWQSSAVDDGPLKKLLADHGLRCASLPSMVMVNRESCTLSFVTRWMTRILTWSRIHELGFWLTAFQMTYATSLIIAIFATLGWAIFTANGPLILWTSIAIVASGIMSVFAWTTIRSCVAELSDSAKDLKPIKLPRFVAALLTVGIAQAVYAIACTRAILSKRLTWRGVSYSVAGRKVALDRYEPYIDGKSAKNSI